MNNNKNKKKNKNKDKRHTGVVTACAINPAAAPVTAACVSEPVNRHGKCEHYAVICQRY